MRIALLILIPPIVLFILALAMILMPLPHPFPEAKSSARNLVAAITTGVLGTIYLVGVTVYAITLFLQGGRLDSALTPLGLVTESYMGFGRRYYGEIDGRQVEITYQPPQTVRPPLLNIAVSADIGTRAALAPKRPLLDCADCPTVDVDTPELNWLLVVAQDGAWMQHLLAKPTNAAALNRLLDNQETLGTRELYFQPERVWLHAHPRQLSEAQLHQWLDDLLALAGATEANAP